MCHQISLPIKTFRNGRRPHISSLIQHSVRQTTLGTDRQQSLETLSVSFYYLFGINTELKHVCSGLQVSSIHLARQLIIPINFCFFNPAFAHHTASLNMPLPFMPQDPQALATGREYLLISRPTTIPQDHPAHPDNEGILHGNYPSQIVDDEHFQDHPQRHPANLDNYDVAILSPPYTQWAPNVALKNPPGGRWPVQAIG